MIQITAYLRTEEDLAKWKALPNKTAWLHERLNEVDKEPELATATIKNVLANEGRVGPTVETEDEYDYLDNLILDTAAGGVFDTETGEKVDADAKMIKELKKRGQVK